ncbi:MAG TPA: hypothetical protein VFS67_15435 [Polyangiaceae bacterium]|nr:hypothetical protein [Polyangiaceae bacterium]
MSVSSLPTRDWVGAARRPSPPARSPFAESPPGPADFARALRTRRWSALVPLLAAIGVGVVLLWSAAAPPPAPLALSATDRPAAGSRSDASYADPAAGWSYELNPNWTWPVLGPAQSSQLGATACTGSGAAGAC